MKQAWYRRKGVVVAFHVLAWIMIFYLPVLLTSSSKVRVNHPHLPPPQTMRTFFLIHNVFWVFIFYANAYLLVPRSILRKKYGFYALGVLGLYALSLLFDWSLLTAFTSNPHWNLKILVYFTIFPFLLILPASTAYWMIAEKIRTDDLARKRERENLKTELSFLRSQISPHFMFNVLNNIISLARIHSDKLEPTVIKLSSLMRYMLYEGDEARVPLNREVEYLQSYIDLQQQRFEGSVLVKTSLEPGPNDLLIEPMLLIPFVENAFKHGIGLIEDPQIEVSLSLEDSHLQFRVANKFNADSSETRDRTSGIGLSNVRRRLELLYGKEHTLIISQKDHWFFVNIQINLHEDDALYRHR